MALSRSGGRTGMRVNIHRKAMRLLCRVVSGEAAFNQIRERRVSCEHRYHRK